MAGGWPCHLRQFPSLGPEQLHPKMPFSKWYERKGNRAPSTASLPAPTSHPGLIFLPGRSQQLHNRPYLQVCSLLAYGQVSSSPWSLQWLPSTLRINLTPACNQGSSPPRSVLPQLHLCSRGSETGVQRLQA